MMELCSLNSGKELFQRSPQVLKVCGRGGRVVLCKSAWQMTLMSGDQTSQMLGVINLWRGRVTLSDAWEGQVCHIIMSFLLVAIKYINLALHNSSKITVNIIEFAINQFYYLFQSRGAHEIFAGQGRGSILAI